MEGAWSQGKRGVSTQARGGRSDRGVFTPLGVSPGGSPAQVLPEMAGGRGQVCGGASLRAKNMSRCVGACLYGQEAWAGETGAF